MDPSKGASRLHLITKQSPEPLSKQTTDLLCIEIFSCAILLLLYQKLHFESAFCFHNGRTSPGRALGIAITTSLTERLFRLTIQNCRTGNIFCNQKQILDAGERMKELSRPVFYLEFFFRLKWKTNARRFFVRCVHGQDAKQKLRKTHLDPGQNPFQHWIE